MISNRKILYLLGFFILICPKLFSQSNEIIITKNYNGLEWVAFIEKIENNYPVQFFYYSDSIPDIKIVIESDSISLEKCLKNNFEKFNMKVSIDKTNNIFLNKRRELPTSLPDNFFKTFKEKKKETENNKYDKVIQKEDKYLKTKNEFIPKTIIIGNKKDGINISKATITGYIKSKNDSSPVIGGSLYIKELKTGTTTNDKGFFTLQIKKGEYTLIVKSLEYEEEKIIANILSSGTLNIELNPKLFLLDEFVVSSEEIHNVMGSQMGIEKLTTKKINEIPVILGERDIIKVALLLPGVQTVGEGSSGFNVRGSPADQNLFYINNVPVYNTSHLFGFFSSFNSDAINDFTLYKSNIPVEYGGRLSSVFNINTKQGNENKFHMMGGISPIAGSILVDGPIKKGKSSYLISLRSTYSDWLLSCVKDQNIKNSKARFGDAISYFSFNLNKKNKLKFFTYFSFDNAKIASITKNDYKNFGASLSWFHYFNDNQNMDVIFSSSKYFFNENNMELDFASFKQSYELNHNELKFNFSYRPNDNHNITYGVNSILYTINRGDYLPLNNKSIVEPKKFESEKGLENGLYVGDNWKINSNLDISVGLRYNIYSSLGPKTVLKFRNNQPRTVENITDTLHFKNNFFIKTYRGIDYRISAKYLLEENLSLKASYNRIHQFVFLLSNTIAISPTDIWKLCNYNIKPMVGKQYSVGIYSNLLNNNIEAYLETYYKKVNYLVEYKDGANFFDNEIPETDIVQGKLDTYGIEFMVKKLHGKLSGWINYTYSNAKVIVKNDIRGEQNNSGFSYPANYDKPHSFNLVANYQVSRRLSFSGNIVYSTGRPITYPTSIYYQEGIEVINYSLRNEYRLPDYFRIDVSIKVEGNLLLKKLAHGSFILSVYNLTGRKNAYSVFFEAEDGKIHGYKLSIFGNPIPSLTYSFKLGNYDN